MALSKVYNYWFDNSIQNIQRHWIPISLSETTKKFKEIETNFMSIYLNCLFKTIHLYKDNSIEYSGIPIKDRLAMVILLDQFTRTLGKQYKNIGKIKKTCSGMCLNIINDVISGKFLKLNPDELLFVLMIYKHIDYKYFTLVYDIVNIYCEYNEKSLVDKDMCNLQKFYIDFYKKYIFNNFPDRQMMNVDYQNIKLFSREYYSQVCHEDGYLPPDFPHTKYNISTIKNNILENTLCSVLKTNIKGNICISLSGGVDSMVLAFILKRLEKKLDIRVCAFHLVYNNRDRSEVEKNLICAFCDNMKIPLCIYKIHHIKRGSINRENYEKITRDIRFACYRQFGCPIVLGHINEDKIENIITNLSTNKHMFDLEKIHLSSIIEGIEIIRPFIDIDKIHIIEYSHINNIPYLDNTTPEWSNRGKFRKDFLPSFKKQYGEMGIKNIINFAETLNNYGDIIEENIIIPNVEKLLDNKSLLIGEKLLNNSHLIREIFKRYSHSKGYSMPSEKSIKHLVVAVKTGKTKNYELSKNIKIRVDNHQFCII
tara:strand:+ start:353 stop:1969 length:1617 start_codon:yes stop_codon:yes gene_type:complete